MRNADRLQLSTIGADVKRNARRDRKQIGTGRLLRVTYHGLLKLCARRQAPTCSFLSRGLVTVGLLLCVCVLVVRFVKIVCSTL